MKAKLPIITVIFLGIILVGFFNAPPDGHTGAPGDSLCSSCHGGNNPLGFDGGIEISGPGPLIVPGATYTISVIVSNPNGLAQRAGFQIVALDENDNNIGTLSNASPNSTLSTQGGRTYFKHNPGVNFPGSNEVEWTVDWTAPAMTNSTSANFYGAGNIADGNGQSSNDFIVTTVLEVDIEAGADPLEITIVSSSNVSCFGGSDGIAEAQASGGEGSYSFLWSNGETSAIANQLSAGMHEVTVTDGGGNSASTSVEIDQADQIEIQLMSQINVSCFGGNDGFLSVGGLGGTGQLSFNWSNGENGESIFNLSSGNYSVTATDENGCTSNASYFISEADPIFITESFQNLSCNGSDDGEISLIVDGGTPPYEVNWSSGDLGISLSDLPAGDYFYTLTDANDCTEVGAITIDAPDEIVLSVSFIDPSCPGCNDGSATVSAVGGVGNFSYSWDTDPPQNTAMASNLTAGSYTVTVSDGNNCEMTAMVTLTATGDCITEGGFYYNQNEVYCTSGSLQNLCYEIQESSLQDSLNLCDTTLLITNPLWYNFVAGDSLFHILANIGNCSPGDGLRIAVFELDCSQSFGAGSDGVLPDGSLILTDCEWMLSPQSGEIEIEVATSPGKIYGLMIEGWEDDQCTFEVLEVFAAGDAPELDDDDLGGLVFQDIGLGTDTVCVGAIGIEFTVEGEVSGACTFIWTLEDKSTGEIIELENEDPVTTVYVDFPIVGEYEVCVVASNLCGVTNPVCVDIVVSSLLPYYVKDTICKREDYTWIGPFGEVLQIIPAPDSAGDYQFDTIAINQWGCEIESFLDLYVIPDNIDDKTPLSAVICRGGGFQMPDGSIYFETGFYGEDNSIFITQASEPGSTYQCDSFFTLDLIVLDIGVFWEDPICIDDQIFIFPDQGISPNPNFQPGFGGEEISWQWIRTSDGDTISANALGQIDSLTGFLTLDKEFHFTQDVETFEWYVQITYEGQPDEPCNFIPGSFRIDLNDFYPAKPDLSGPDRIAPDSLLSLMVSSLGDPNENILYFWEVNSDPDDFTIINDSTDTVLELIFHRVGVHEVCVYASNECGNSERSCIEIEVELGVSIEDPVGDLYGVRVFPNPAEDYLIIKSKDIKGEIDIRIFDSAGKVVKFNSRQFDRQSHLDLRGLSPGVYFIQIYHKGTVFREHFVKK